MREQGAGRKIRGDSRWSKDNQERDHRSMYPGEKSETDYQRITETPAIIMTLINPGLTLLYLNLFWINKLNFLKKRTQKKTNKINVWRTLTSAVTVVAQRRTTRKPSLRVCIVSHLQSSSVLTLSNASFSASFTALGSLEEKSSGSSSLVLHQFSHLFYFFIFMTSCPVFPKHQGGISLKLSGQPWI